MKTEAQKRANEKYDEKFFMVRFRMPIEKYEKIKQLANDNEESMASLFNRLANQELIKSERKSLK